jgi:subtilase family serine protease
MARGLRLLRLMAPLLAVAIAGASSAGAQSDGPAEFRAIPNHVPAWANDGNFLEAVPAEQAMAPMTLVLARHPDRQQAFEKLLADQQDPSSPDYQHWLTSTEIGERFGLSTEELDEISGWLESQGMHVDWVAPARNFIGFSGSAGDVGGAFQTDLNFYTVNGERKMSIASPPMVPAALAPLVKAITGLYTLEAQPSAHVHDSRANSSPIAGSASPEFTFGSGSSANYLIGPADFNAIYDVPADLTGKGVTIGILGRAHTDFADYANFEKLAGITFANPTEIVPAAYGGKDPGPALTSPPTGSAPTFADQVEAEGDVMREGSVAPDVKLLLVVASAASGGLHPDAQYLIQSDPVPAQIITAGYHECEAEAGPSEVDLWNSLFSQAAAKGISVFISSGDTGASGCGSKFAKPPNPPFPISINSLCSSSYLTCVGGTEFNDASDYSKYWNSSNEAGLLSAKGYIPEGGWNDPWNTDTPPTTQTAASGGGASEYIPTPSWQTGTGVPAARTGRYTPDLAFSASLNNGYLGCFAAAGAGCTSSGDFVAFAGTSAGADSMGGVTALLDQKLGKAQGNLAPHLYEMVKSSPSAFHDVTVATSGVSNCSLKIPSLCNNSLPSPKGLTGGQEGYEVGVGYDEVTGLGSLDVGRFLASYLPFKAPVATTGLASLVKAVSATLGGKVSPNGQETEYWFEYGTSSTLSSSFLTHTETLAGTSPVTVSARIAGLVPGTKYYFRLMGSSLGGNSTGKIATFATKKEAQTIIFTQPRSPVKVGAVIALSAKSSSGLAVTFSVVKGHAKLSGSTLTVTAAGTVEVAANQAGNHYYLPATEVTRSITVQ